jgi:hypothetical protein
MIVTGFELTAKQCKRNQEKRERQGSEDQKEEIRRNLDIKTKERFHNYNDAMDTLMEEERGGKDNRSEQPYAKTRRMATDLGGVSRPLSTSTTPPTGEQRFAQDNALATIVANGKPSRPATGRPSLPPSECLMRVVACRLLPCVLLLLVLFAHMIHLVDLRPIVDAITGFNRTQYDNGRHQWP